MKILKINLLSLICLIGLNSCQQNSAEDYSISAAEAQTEELQPQSTENSDSILSSSAATYQDKNRKLVRTSDVSMEVENVYESTTKIESKVTELGGFVTESKLQSQIKSVETFPTNRDSALEVKRYKVGNEMTVRIPQENLGTFLISLNDEIKFLNHRTITANDVSLNYEKAKLDKERIDFTNNQLIDLNQQKGKIEDKKDVIQTINSNKVEQNHQKLNTLKLEDEVNYATVSLDLFEKEKIAETMVFNPDTYSQKFRPDFLYSVTNSLKGGLYLMETLFLGLLYLWPLFLLGILIFILIKTQIRKHKIKS